MTQNNKEKSKHKTNLEQANYEADHHIYARTYKTFEDYKKAMHQ
ncbi:MULTISPECIES: hypothetical protein [Lactobacillus]|nr:MULTISPECIES: hypothetical protein [Lactobacillus]